MVTMSPVIEHLPGHLAAIQNDAIGAVEILDNRLARARQDEGMVTAHR